ncbi:MAG TPA: hypothetical protein VGH14_06990 [Solirubrobacterales bacterium]
MIGRKSIVGVALFSVFAFLVVAVQGAAAREYEPTTNTTAVTCAPQEKGEFSDEHCDSFVGAPNGKFSHVRIAPGTSTSIEVTNEKTGPETKSAEKAVLKGTLFGVESLITAETVSGTGSIKNVESGTNMQVEGEVTTKFTKVKVDKPEGCSIQEPIEFTTKFRGVKDKAAPTRMGLEFFPKEGNTFVILHLSGGLLCPANAEVTGTTVATGGSSGEHGSGATAVFTEEDSNLKFGGNPASFTGKFTTRMSGGGNPIALTTNAP